MTVLFELSQPKASGLMELIHNQIVPYNLIDLVYNIIIIVK